MPFNQLLMSYFYNSQKEEKLPWRVGNAPLVIFIVYYIYLHRSFPPSAGQYSHFLRIIRAAHLENGCMTLFLSAEEITVKQFLMTLIFSLDL